MKLLELLNESRWITSTVCEYAEFISNKVVRTEMDKFDILEHVMI